MTAKLLRKLPDVLFWTWNGLFLAFAVLGVGLDLFFGEAPITAPRAFLTLAVCAVPLVAMRLARTLTAPAERLTLLYGVEAPVLTLLLLRILALEAFSPAAWFLFGVAVVCAAVLIRDLVAAPGRWPLDLAAHAILLAAGVYGVVLALLYVVPAGWLLGGQLLSFDWADGLLRAITRSNGAAVPALLLGAMLLAYTATLWLAAPFVFCGLAARAFRRAWRRSAASPAGATVVVAGSVGALLFGFVLMAAQPTREVFATLAQPPETAEALQARVNSADALRSALLDVWNAEQRYVGVQGRRGAVGHLHREAFGLSAEAVERVLSTHDALASPFLYEGQRPSKDRARARALFAEFFDAPIAEPTVNAWSGPAKAVRRVVHVEPHDGWAEVELQIAYENPGFGDREATEAFTLPENAAHRYAFASPWSSWVVFVNQEQWRQLAKAEAGDDRFTRVEPPTPSTLDNAPFSVSGTPEPATWCLLLLAGGIAAGRRRLTERT